MVGVDWVAECTGNPNDGPLGRLPALRTLDAIIPESGFIQSYLESEGAEFYPGLSTSQRAHAHALTRMIEEHLRLGVVHDRWLVDACWEQMKPIAFASIPAPIRPFIANMARRQVRAGLKGQGLARMSEAQRLQCFQPDLECLTDHLWDTPYLLGDAPTAPDTIAVPVLSMLAGLPAHTALREAVRKNSTMMAYVERGRETLYPKSIRSAAAV